MSNIKIHIGEELIAGAEVSASLNLDAIERFTRKAFRELITRCPSPLYVLAVTAEIDHRITLYYFDAAALRTFVRDSSTAALNPKSGRPLGPTYWYGLRKGAFRYLSSNLNTGLSRQFADLAIQTCVPGDPARLGRSLAKLGVELSAGRGVESDGATAVQCLMRAANMGAVSGMVVLARWYTKGRGVKQDYGKAFALFCRASAKGDWRGRVGVAECYENGMGVARDLRRAYRLYDEASRLSMGREPEIEHRLGFLNWSGEGTSRDLVKAREYFQKASRHGGGVKGLLEFAVCLEEGLGGPRDVHRAFTLYQQAAPGTQPHVYAFWLGRCFLNGIGVSMDLDQANKQFVRAARAIGALGFIGMAHVATLKCGGSPSEDLRAGIGELKKLAFSSSRATPAIRGAMLAVGYGTGLDRAQAVEVLIPECDRPNVAGCVLLALLTADNPEHELVDRMRTVLVDSGFQLGQWQYELLTQLIGFRDPLPQRVLPYDRDQGSAASDDARVVKRRRL